MTPERLDDLAAGDPAALRSRRDLQRIHRAMRSVAILKGGIHRLGMSAPPRRVLELGAGDGTLLLRLARSLYPFWRGVELTLLDRQDLLTPRVREEFRKLDWNVSFACIDAIAWARQPSVEQFDLCITTLFLHHFESHSLALLLKATATRTNAFMACEPRRNNLSRIGSRLIGILGANDVTREDGVKSVNAGFGGRELTEIWESVPGAWQVNEYLAWPFTHCFIAGRVDQPPGSNAD